ncbi:MAG: nucleotidyltransferase [Candidatus Latescibacterota bacterium]
MSVLEDFEEFLRLLTEQHVAFLVVGGYAVAFHGYVRATHDIDLFYRNSEENVRRILPALRSFGLPADEGVVAALRDPGSIVRVGVPPVRIELINEISGVDFAEAWERRVEGRYGQVEVGYISYGDLLSNRKAAGRPKDLADIDELGGNREA